MQKIITLLLTRIFLKVLRPVCLCVCFITVHLNINAQMRQVYIDNLQPENSIKKISFYSSSAGYVAFTNWIGFTTDTGRTFNKKYITLSNVDFNGYPNVNLTFGFSIYGVKAFNQNVIIAYGHYGLIPSILYSTDGGNTFKLVYHYQFNVMQANSSITDMVFPENNTIGYATNADQVLKTLDGGLTWNAVDTDPGSYFNQIQAIDNNNVFVMNTTFENNKLVKTYNGGSNWQSVTLPALTNENMNCSYFLTATTGFLNMTNGGIYKTTNGGNTWTLINNLDASKHDFDKLKFINDSVGYALESINTIYKTFNAGINWEPLPRDNSFAYFGFSHKDFQFLNINQFWAGGGGGLLELSTNAGGTPLPKAHFVLDSSNVATTHTINLINFSLAGYQYKWFINNVLLSTSYNTSYTHDIYTGNDTIKLLVTKGAYSDSVTRYAYFEPQIKPPAPSITSFSPVEGITGTIVTIKGINFTGLTAITFGGTSATSFTVKNDTTAEAIVGTGASGNIVVSNSIGSASLPGFLYTIPLRINSFSPSSGPIGTLVTINGTKFSSNEPDNIVLFGSVRASVISSTPTQLVVMVPAGGNFQPISVRVNGLIATSSSNFTITFANGGTITKSTFPRTSDFAAQLGAVFLSTSDLDGDGKIDIITTSPSDLNLISVLRNISNDTAILFEPKKSFKVQDGYYFKGTFAIFDVNGDGKNDILANGISSLYYLENISSGNKIEFSPGKQLPNTENFNSEKMIAADFNGDGKIDLFSKSGGVKILKNTTTSGVVSFNQTLLPNLGSVTNCILNDFNNDGKPDLFYTLATSDFGQTLLFLNTSNGGDISFSQQNLFSLPYLTTYTNWKTGDIDNDGKSDLIAISPDSLIYIYRNTSANGNISFEAPKQFISSYPIGYLEMNDVNGDGKLDLITSVGIQYLSFENKIKRLTILENLSTPGNILFAEKVDNFYSTVNPHGTGYISVADLNADGKPEVIGISFSDSSIVSVFHNLNGTQDENVCAGDGTSLLADINGSSYQWQLDTGTGFINVSNNANISGANQFTLNISSVPSGWYGYKFRCLVDGNKYSKTSFIRVLNFFTGLQDNHWENPINWSCGFLPDKDTEVIFNQPFTLIINSNVSVRRLTLRNGRIVINPGFTVTLTH